MTARPIEIEVAGDIGAPPETVWPYLVDWERLHRWMKEGSSFRVTSPHREGLGVEAEATIRIGGLTTTDPIRVVRWEPPQVLEVEHRGWVRGSGLMRCVRTGSGTRVEWRETLLPPLGPLGAAGLRAWRPLMQRTFRRDLELLKALVESEQPAG